jgi:hypothetical protein
MKTSPLITDFPPLPSQDLILDAIRKQNPHSHVTSLPSGGGPTQSGPVVYPNQPVITGGPPPPPPQFCWCCINGEVHQTTYEECRRSGAQCYGSREEAIRHCKEAKKNCWCCVEGQVAQTTEAECRSREGQCYGSRKEASRHCRGEGATPNQPYPTPTPTPHRPHHPKDTNPKGPGYGGSGQVINPYGPRPTPTPWKQPIKRLPGRLKPTPTPSKIY